MSARQYDTNGWFEVKRNPLSKVGVFPYLGSSIGAPDPDRVYMVYRPAEELADPATIASFRLLPFVDDHTMLGDSGDGLTAAEHKGVHGVIGEAVEFDGDTLYGNLKVFSEDLARKIDLGKKEVSCGYRCHYDFTPGTFRGQSYEAVQRTIRGNHLALVDQGRMGPDVAVLDHLTFTFDAKDLIAPMDPELVEKIVAAAQAIIAAVKPAGAGDPAASGEETTVGEAGEETTVGDGGADTIQGDAGGDTITGDDTTTGGADSIPGGDGGADTVAGDGQDGADMDKTGMDALRAENEQLKARLAALEAKPTVDAAEIFAQAAQRDALANRLKPHVGTFDHAPMTLAQVAAYGVEKLQIQNVPTGQEAVALDAWLSAKGDPSQAAATHGEDGATHKPANFVQRHLNPTDAA